MSRVIIKNLPTDCQEETLKELVSRIGTITDVSLKVSGFSFQRNVQLVVFESNTTSDNFHCYFQFTKNGVFRKFAFVGFLQESEANNAVKLLDKSFLHSSRLSVQVIEVFPRHGSKFRNGRNDQDLFVNLRLTIPHMVFEGGLFFRRQREASGMEQIRQGQFSESGSDQGEGGSEGEAKRKSR